MRALRVTAPPDHQLPLQDAIHLQTPVVPLLLHHCSSVQPFGLLQHRSTPGSPRPGPFLLPFNDAVVDSDHRCILQRGCTQLQARPAHQVLVVSTVGMRSSVHLFYLALLVSPVVAFSPTPLTAAAAPGCLGRTQRCSTSPSLTLKMVRADKPFHYQSWLWRCWMAQIV